MISPRGELQGHMSGVEKRPRIQPKGELQGHMSGVERVRNRRGDKCPEVRVIWRGAVERLVPTVSHLTRPILAGSPPLEERSWVATPDWGEDPVVLIHVGEDQFNANQEDAGFTHHVRNTYHLLGCAQRIRRGPNGPDQQEATTAGDVARVPDEGKSAKTHTKWSVTEKVANMFSTTTVPR